MALSTMLLASMGDQNGAPPPAPPPGGLNQMVAPPQQPAAPPVPQQPVGSDITASADLASSSYAKLLDGYLREGLTSMQEGQRAAKSARDRWEATMQPTELSGFSAAAQGITGAVTANPKLLDQGNLGLALASMGQNTQAVSQKHDVMEQAKAKTLFDSRQTDFEQQEKRVMDYAGKAQAAAGRASKVGMLAKTLDASASAAANQAVKDYGLVLTIPQREALLAYFYNNHIERGLPAISLQTDDETFGVLQNNLLARRKPADENVLRSIPGLDKIAASAGSTAPAASPVTATPQAAPAPDTGPPRRAIPTSGGNPVVAMPTGGERTTRADYMTLKSAMADASKRGDRKGYAVLLDEMQRNYADGAPPEGIPSQHNAVTQSGYAPKADTTQPTVVPNVATPTRAAATLGEMKTQQAGAEQDVKSAAQTKYAGFEEDSKKTGSEMAELRSKTLPELKASLDTARSMALRAENDQLFHGPTADFATALGGVASLFDPQGELAKKAASSEAYVAQLMDLVRTKIKALGSGTAVSNLDLITTKDSLGGLTTSAQGKRLILNALALDMENALKSGQSRLDHFKTAGHLRDYTMPVEPDSLDIADPKIGKIRTVTLREFAKSIFKRAEEQKQPTPDIADIRRSWAAEVAKRSAKP